RTRSSPSAIVLGCSRSQCASQSCSDSMAALSPAYDSRMAITLYGIPNCDTVKKARAWLAAQGADYAFHDFRKQGVPPDRLDRWMASADAAKLLNRQGTTWRRLDAAAQAGASDTAG